MSLADQSCPAAGWPTDLVAQALALPLEGLVASARARKAFATLGIVDIAGLIATPRERLLEMPGFGQRTLAGIERALGLLRRKVGPSNRALESPEAPSTFDLIPVALLAFPTESLGLPAGLRRVLHDADLHDVEALLRASERLRQDAAVGSTGVAEIRAAIDRLLAPALRSTVHALDGGTLPALIAQCLSALEEAQRTLLVRRIGIGAEPLPLGALAVRCKTTLAALREDLAAIRDRLHTRAAGCLSRLYDAAQAELSTREGCLTAQAIPPGTILHAPRSTGLRPDLALRLLAFCYPQQLHLDGEALTVATRRQIGRLATLLRRIGPQHGAPVY